MPAVALSTLVSRYLFFSRLAPPRACDASSRPQKQSASAAALTTADQTRFRHLTKLMIAAMRNANRPQHFGSLIVTPNHSYALPAQVATVVAEASTAAGRVALSVSSAHWLYQTRRLVQILLDHIRHPTQYGMDSVSNEILLLWMIVDANQWPFIKAAGQATAAEKATIQQTQYALVASLVVGSTYGRPRTVAPAAAAVAAAASSSAASIAASSSFAAAASSSSSSPAAPRTPPLLDLFSALRHRILDLTIINKENAATAAQLQHKTSVALLFATVLRCVTLSTTAVGSRLAEQQMRVMTSFVYHIFSLPVLPQRLRYMGLAALLPSFLAPALWDRAMEVLTSTVLRLNMHSPSGVLSFARRDFSSFSFTWHDQFVATPAAAPTRASKAQRSSAPDAAASSSSSAAASSAAVSSPSSASPYAIFSVQSPPSDSVVVPISGVAWCLGNCLEFVTLLDETKSDATSLSFSHFLAAIEQLIVAVPEHEFPALGHEVVANPMLPPSFTQQFAIVGERSFLDRLCRRLLAEPSLTPAATTAANDTTMKDVPASSSSAAALASPGCSPTAASSSASLTALNDVPIICVLIDSILFKWGVSSNAILNTLVFSSGIVAPLWRSIKKSGLIERIVAAGKAAPPVAMVSSSSSSSSASSSCVHPIEALFSDRFFNLLPLFCTMYGHLLIILDDNEFHVQQKPFSLESAAEMVSILKVLLYHLYWSGFSHDATPARLRQRFTRLFCQLRDRQSRRPFMPPDDWLFTHAFNSIPIETVRSELAAEEALAEEVGVDNASTLLSGRASSLIRNIPFVLPFADRVKLFYSHIQQDKQRLRAGGVQFDHGMGRHVRIRRSTVLEDGFESLYGLSGADLKGRIRVQFTDEHGLEEAGLDGGGLFKEFLTTLFKRAFDPSYNLFAETTAHFLYPNPLALDLPIVPQAEAGMMADLQSEHADQTLSYFHFIGSMVGKALYDEVQIETQFALFFLRACIGLANYVDDLQGLDPQIYNSLMKLKTLDESSLADMQMTFSVDRCAFGVVRSVDLIPRGSEIAVTTQNRVRFIYAMSNYYLSEQIKKQSAAFAQGLQSVINPSWLRMFAAEEIRLLISGSQTINLDDLRAHTNYSSGYTEGHELIGWFWQVMAEMSADELGCFLRFCTSCSRAPLLGFGALQPGFCIQVSERHTPEKPPSAALPLLLTFRGCVFGCVSACECGWSGAEFTDRGDMYESAPAAEVLKQTETEGKAHLRNHNGSARVRTHMSGYCDRGAQAASGRLPTARREHVHVTSSSPHELRRFPSHRHFTCIQTLSFHLNQLQTSRSRARVGCQRHFEIVRCNRIHANGH